MLKEVGKVEFALKYLEFVTVRQRKQSQKLQGFVTGLNSSITQADIPRTIYRKNLENAIYPIYYN